MDEYRTIKSSHESRGASIVNPERGQNTQSAFKHKYESALDGQVHHISVRMNVHSTPQKNKMIQALSRISTHGWKKSAAPFSSLTIQDEEKRPNIFRFVVTINRLAKSILIYPNNPIWKQIGIALLPTMQEYREAWVDLLKALIKNIKTPLRYTCFLTLLSKAVAQDLASILKRFHKHLPAKENSSIQNALRRFQRSSEWKYSELGSEADRQGLKELYNANIVVESDLLIGLSTIQHFAELFAGRSNPGNTGPENYKSDLPMSMQLERVKEVLYKMSEARQLLGGKLEVETYSCESLRYT